MRAVASLRNLPSGLRRGCAATSSANVYCGSHALSLAFISCFNRVFARLCLYAAHVRCLSMFRDSLSVLEGGTDRLSRNVGKKLPTYAA
jgi:hypothetical protein